MVPENGNRKSEGFSVTYFQDQQGYRLWRRPRKNATIHTPPAFEI